MPAGGRCPARNCYRPHGDGIQHAKLRDLLVPDLMDYRNVEADPRGFDACFFCLGVSSAGMDEARYTLLTYDLTLALVWKYWRD